MDFKKITEKYQNDCLNTLSDLIKINSVYDEKTISEDAPYGIGVKKAMTYMKEIALKDGFNVDTCDNRCLEISYGEGKQLIGIFAHLDVVPATGEWEFEPFGATIFANKMFGRGTSDDKGPGVSAYYALKALKDNNLIKNYRVKLVFGGDEERGSSCLEYYFKTLKKEDVTYGFTPDGDFPLIYGEKGITNYKIEGNLYLGPVIEIDAGIVSNSVIDKAIVLTHDKNKLLAYLKVHPEIKYEILSEEEDIIKINFIGKSAHGSLPHLGINSGIIALEVLSKAFDLPLLKKISFDYKNPFGKNLDGGYYVSKEMGETTYNVGIIKYKNCKFEMTVNFRYPENVNSKEVIEKLKENTDLPITVLSESNCLYFDPNTPFIKLLSEVYVKETNDTKNKPMTIGGGTYAKEAKNTVAFGSHFMDKVDHIHEPNEKIDLEDLFNSMAIYAHAIYALGNLK